MMLGDRRGLLFDLAATANEPPETKEGQGLLRRASSLVPWKGRSDSLDFGDFLM